MVGVTLEGARSSVSTNSPSASLEAGSESSAPGLVSSSGVLFGAVGRRAGRLDNPEDADPAGPCKLCLFVLAAGPDIDVRAVRVEAGGGGGPIEDFVVLGRVFGVAADDLEAPLIEDRGGAGVVELDSCFVGDFDGVYIQIVSARSWRKYVH